MRFVNTRLYFLFYCLVLSPLCKAYQQQVVVTASSDWIYHGSSESAGEPALGLNGELQLNNFFLGAELHQAGEPGPRQRQRSVAAYLGYSFFVDPRWLASISYGQRVFPGSVKEWDYREWSTHLSYQNNQQTLALDIDYAEDYYDHDTEVLVAELNYSRELNRHWQSRLGVGLVELSEASYRDYHYAHIGAAYAVNVWVVDLAYHWNSEAGARLFGAEINSPGWVLTISYQLY